MISPVLQLGVRIPGADAFPLTQSQLAPLMTLTPSFAEPEAQGHWLFGSDYDTGSPLEFPDLLSGALMTAHGAAPTVNANDLVLAVGANYLSSPYDDAAEQTLCCVVKQQPLPSTTGNGAAIFGLWTGSAGAAIYNLKLPSTGAGFYAYSELGGILHNEQISLPGATGDWIFMAMGFAPQRGARAAARRIFTSGGHTLVTNGVKTAASAGNKVGLGNPGESFTSETGSLTAAEFIVFDKYLTLAEMEAVYARSQARLATRSITVV